MSDHRPCLVVVDRDGAARTAMGAALAAIWEVLTADSVATAIVHLRGRAVDLLLVRAAAPGLDGLDLVRRMRAEAAFQAIPVILFTERANENDVLEGFHAGADDYLFEPFSTRVLVAQISQQLRIGRLRRAAAAREQQLTAVFDQAAVGIAQADLSGLHLLVNQRYCDIVGRPMEAVLTMRVMELTHPDDVAPNLDLWQRMVDTGAGYVIEKRYLRPDGALMWVNIRVTLLRDADGAPSSAIAVAQDITERKRAETALHELTDTLEQRIAERTRELTTEIEERRAAEAALRHEQAFSELVIESSTEAIMAIDTTQRYTLWNTAAEALTGLARGDVLGHSLNESMPQIMGTSIERAWLAALAGRPSVVHDRAYTIPSTRRSGVYDASFTPLHDPDGTIIGALGLLRDITVQRRAEEALRQSQKMEAVGQLTGGVAHDFNNLLTVITGNLETMQRRLPVDSPLHRQIDAALRGTDRAATLTQRLLAFSRRQPLDPKPVEADKLVLGMSDLLRRTLGEMITVETAVAVGTGLIRCDPNQLESAILNLAVNSRDAMPNGGKLTIAATDARIDDGDETAHGDLTPGDYVMIAVADTGTGMTRDIAEKAFEPFFTTKEVGQGTGLGLSQVYGFAKQSGGHVTIDSTPGAGTSIKLYLPRLVASAVRTPIAIDAAAVPHAPRPATILLVEDDDDVRAHTADLLRELGYGVIEAPDGPTALERIGLVTELQLLFTDVALPGGMDGRALALAARHRRPTLKVLFTTGYARDAIANHGTLEPDVELIVKPFTYANLAAKIHAVLGDG